MAQTEQKKSYHVTKDFKGLNTKANRTAIDQNEFSWLENVMPVGYGNLRIIPNYTPTKATASASVTSGKTYVVVSGGATTLAQWQAFFSALTTIPSNGDVIVATATGSIVGGATVGLFAILASVNEYVASGDIGNTSYLFFFQTDGSCEALNLTNNTLSTVAAAATFSGSGVQIAQWKNERILIIDPVKGYFNWNGTNLVSMGSVNGITITNGGTSYSGTLTVTISAPNQTGGVQATAKATASSGVITNITVTEAGSADLS